ncbi:MAG TPA: transposase [Bryobacteraceae bacterium]|nr:transposase [Bryobacteraceae bacterium]
MARFARAVAVGVAHHITQRGVDHQRTFFTDADRHTYLQCLETYCVQARMRVLAYCLMPNHIHLIAIPEEPHSLAIALRRTHGRYALYLNARRHRAGHLWQNRFYSCALDERHLWAALRYVEKNPVRANLAPRPEDYSWSSAAAHVAPNPTSSLLDWEFHAHSGGRETWAALLAEPEELLEIRALQRGTFTGRPVGSAEFLARLEQQLGRRLASRKNQYKPAGSTAAASQ